MGLVRKKKWLEAALGFFMTLEVWSAPGDSFSVECLATLLVDHLVPYRDMYIFSKLSPHHHIYDHHMFESLSAPHSTMVGLWSMSSIGSLY